MILLVGCSGGGSGAGEKKATATDYYWFTMNKEADLTVKANAPNYLTFKKARNASYQLTVELLQTKKGPQGELSRYSKNSPIKEIKIGNFNWSVIKDLTSSGKPMVFLSAAVKDDIVINVNASNVALGSPELKGMLESLKIKSDVNLKTVLDVNSDINKDKTKFPKYIDDSNKATEAYLAGLKQTKLVSANNYMGMTPIEGWENIVNGVNSDSFLFHKEKGKNDNTNFVQVTISKPFTKNTSSKTMDNQILKAGYNMDQLKQSLQAHMKKYPNIYKTLNTVKLGNTEFFECDVTTSGVLAKSYFAVYKDQKIEVRVVGKALEDEKVKKALNTLAFTFYQGQEEYK